MREDRKGEKGRENKFFFESKKKRNKFCELLMWVK